MHHTQIDAIVSGVLNSIYNASTGTEQPYVESSVLDWLRSRGVKLIDECHPEKLKEALQKHDGYGPPVGSTGLPF